MFTKRVLSVHALLICLLICLLFASQGWTAEDERPFQFDRSGLPVIQAADDSQIIDAHWVAVCALQYAGQPSLHPTFVHSSRSSFQKCAQWLFQHHRTLKDGTIVWPTRHETGRNRVCLMTQSLAIQTLILYGQIFKSEEPIALAEKGAAPFLKSNQNGGFLIPDSELTWFEKRRANASPRFVMLDQMAALTALRSLHDATSSEDLKRQYAELHQRGLASLRQRLSAFDAGYWLRGELAPRQEVTLRFTNPYGFPLASLAIESVILRHPDRDDVVRVQVADDAKAGSARVAGPDWLPTETIQDRLARRLRPIVPGHPWNDPQNSQPQTLVHLPIPLAWNLAEHPADLTLEVSYLDDQRANVQVQIESLIPGEGFVDLPEGALLCRAGGEWTGWRIPLRAAMLGTPTDRQTMLRLRAGLAQLGRTDAGVQPWAARADVYLATRGEQRILANQGLAAEQTPPEQTTPLDLFRLDENGVIQQFIADTNTRFEDGNWDIKSSPGKPVYSPFVIAMQALATERLNQREARTAQQFAERYPHLAKREGILTDYTKISAEPAMEWLRRHAIPVHDSLVWRFGFANTYNDVRSQGDWQSAYAQKYIIEAFAATGETDFMNRAARAYLYSTAEGGVTFFANNQAWFEEVPSNTHILNGHITSLVTLSRIAKESDDARLQQVFQQGMESLIANHALFDTGYWCRYDQNPRKELLFQIEWLDGESSPAIHEIRLESPFSGAVSSIRMRDQADLVGPNSLSGIDWDAVKTHGKFAARQMVNGRWIRTEAPVNGVLQNSFVRLTIPGELPADSFEMPPLRLVIVYKDVAAGTFNLRLQAIHQASQFVPLQHGVWNCRGDGEWKEAVFQVRPQDLGWYVGPSYQEFIIDELKQLYARQPNPWLKQMIDRQTYYLTAHENREDVIVAPATPDLTSMENVAMDAKLLSAPPTYEKHGVGNALDGDPNDDYVAARDVPLPHSFLLDLKQERDVRRITLVWESSQNYGRDYLVEVLDPKYRVVQSHVETEGEGKYQFWMPAQPVHGRFVRVTLNRAVGQNRLLMRELQIWVDKQ